jgi:hypothetical protein
MEDPWFHFFLSLLATWRIAHLLAYEDGPRDILVRLRTRLGDGSLGRLVDCFQCVSLWAAVPFALIVGRGMLEWGLAWLGLSGGACLLDRLGREPVVMQRLATKGDDDVLLRREADGATGEPPAESATQRSDAGVIRAVR